MMITSTRTCPTTSCACSKYSKPKTAKSDLPGNFLRPLEHLVYGINFPTETDKK
jgi:hypothetical protein